MNSSTTRPQRARTRSVVDTSREATTTYPRSAGARIAMDPALRYDQVMLGGR